MKKRFSMRNKLLIIFGMLIATAAIIEGLLAVQTSRKDKATDTAEIIDGRISAMFQFLEGLARMPSLQNHTLSFTEKTQSLIKEAEMNTNIEYFGVCDMQGNRYSADGKKTALADRQWFKAASQGKKCVSEPLLSRTSGKLQIVFAVPIYDSNKNITSVLSAGINGLWLSNQIGDIIVGQTGYCYILGLDGNIIAFKDYELVQSKWNTIEEAKKDPGLKGNAEFERRAMGTDESSVGYYIL